MKKKSILFFGWYFYPKVGGAETILLNQARELAARGYKISVLTSVLSNNIETEEEIFGIKVFRRKYVNAREPQNHQAIKRDLVKIISQISPNVFHFHNGSYPSGGNDKSIGAKTIVTIFNIVKMFNIPIIEHAHNAQLRNPEATLPLRQLPWDYLLCVSDFVRQEWQKLGTNAKIIKVVYNGIDMEIFSEVIFNKTMLDVKRNDDVVLFSPARLFSLTTGELNKQKNLQLVFDALGILIEKKINNFVLVSIKNEVYDNNAIRSAEQLVNKIIRDKKLEGKIKFIPVIDPDKMPGFYAGSDIICVPSLYETFGLMYLEAMAAGKVVIASNTGGPKEYIKNNENGYFVDPYDSKELAELLAKLIKSESLRRRIGNKAKIDARKFSIKSMVDEVEFVYKQLF